MAAVGTVQATDVTLVTSQTQLLAAMAGNTVQREDFDQQHAANLLIQSFGGPHVVGMNGQSLLNAGVYGASYLQSIGASGAQSAQYLDTVSTADRLETVWFLGQATSALGANWDLGPWGTGENLKVYAVFGGQEQLVAEIGAGTLGGQSQGYLGFVASSSFSALIIRGARNPGANAETYSVDDIAYGVVPPKDGNQEVTPVPEPESAAMMGLGLAMLAGLRRRAMHRAAAAQT
ncbi:MAG TPA: PEP-CTERM sorting domain-containing protein [Burkholderiaceae bacterium]|nr:PEP-CTERM sorting domain-containing protein [Burkholderiaceae bacterium]HNB42742.1 PEP-CTERM sorting domain-containing protein [Burkholderiaceae bacterium]